MLSHTVTSQQSIICAFLLCQCLDPAVACSECRGAISLGFSHGCQVSTEDPPWDLGGTSSRGGRLPSPVHLSFSALLVPGPVTASGSLVWQSRTSEFFQLSIESIENVTTLSPTSKYLQKDRSL
jgi:hypothetical protein